MPLVACPIAGPGPGATCTGGPPSAPPGAPGGPSEPGMAELEMVVNSSSKDTRQTRAISRLPRRPATIEMASSTSHVTKSDSIEAATETWPLYWL